jgi:hypothetical protein
MASDLVPGDTNQMRDLFVYDVASSNTVILTASMLGNRSGNSISFGGPWLGADGRSVLFQSFASDLASGDYNGGPDLFLMQLGAGDSDGDTMDDDWEWAYFGTLARNGSLDSDGDGLSDLAEFQAGTNPLNKLSVLRALTVSNLASGTCAIVWSTTPQRRYHLQYRTDDAAGEWLDIPGEIVATSTTASAQDTPPPGASRRFYRVVLVP